MNKRGENVEENLRDDLKIKCNDQEKRSKRERNLISYSPLIHCQLRFDKSSLKSSSKSGIDDGKTLQKVVRTAWAKQCG